MKVLLVLLTVFFVQGAYATEETANASVGQVIVDRMSCSDMSAKMMELSGIINPDEDTVIELGKLKSDYRRRCMKSAAGRKTSAQGRVVIVAETTDEKTEMVNDTKDKDIVAEDSVMETEQQSVVKEEKNNSTENKENLMLATEEEIKMLHELMNLDMGLCADGTKPNKFGCCTDEIFKDLGNEVYACCPKTGGDCYPPLK